MLKRFYSKRSGFTLVEIVVAFAVFAIMAAMIAQILDLSVKARQSNNLYAQTLAEQQKVLTVVEKEKDYYTEADKTGIYTLTFTDGESISMGYQVKAADPSNPNQSDGLNYFLSDVDYSCSPVTDSSASSTDSGGMSQASRMDTRITGTAGIGKITFYQVIKDEWSTDIPAGHTRYWIEVAASSVNTSGETTLKKEDVPYAQYRLYFYSDQRDLAKSSVQITDDSGTYTKDYYQEAKIVGIGMINTDFASAKSTGLTDSNTSDGSRATSQNEYLVQQVGTNSVRIGTPFGNSGGKRLEGSKFTRFYVEFEGDPHLSVTSFGQNCTIDGTKAVYTACPQYKDTFNAAVSGVSTPKYETVGDGKVHPSIYGAYLYSRRYS